MAAFDRFSSYFVLAIVNAGAFLPSGASAQDEAFGVQEIIVTAQRREQSIQDVAIAITALNPEALQANRITTVTDLAGITPGLYTAPTPGGSRIPQFSMRGTTSNGSVQGSDRSVGIYIDGVYVGGSNGSVFDLPEVQRIEVLRGPQGTLFGRNSTAGAISVTTRDPTGEMGVKVTGTAGNRHQHRLGISVDLPQIGPFSGLVSYLHEERRGDVRNTAAGMLWDRTAIPKIGKIASISNVQPAASYLGSANMDSWFAAIKFESGDFTTVYKFDRQTATESPAAVGLGGYAPTGLGPLISALINTQSFAVPLASDGKRPEAVANGWAISNPREAQGHSLTSIYQITDNIAVKNIFALRKSFIFGAQPLDGVSGLVVTEQTAPFVRAFGFAGSLTNQQLVGALFTLIPTASQGRSNQISDELQFTYNSPALTATGGGLWYKAIDRRNEHLLQNSPSFRVFPGGIVPSTNVGRTKNEVTSLSAYAQVELHATDQFDIILGGRLTHDKKDGELFFGPTVATAQNLIAPTYKKSNFSYLMGFNYKPNDDTLIYAKYSTGFVSGGNTSGVSYVPETVKAWEGGVKATLFERKIQANLALFYANYKKIQGANSTTTPGIGPLVNQVTGDPNRATVVTTIVFNNGDLKAKGFEFDLTAAPTDGLTFGGSLGYTDSKFQNIDPLILAANGGTYQPILLPAWTGYVWGQYDSPKFGNSETYISFRGDARWQSDMNFNANPNMPEYLTWARNLREAPAYWVLNGRVALKDLDIAGVKTELAAWGRNLADNRSASYILNLGVIAGANYIPARSYGLDMTVEF